MVFISTILTAVLKNIDKRYWLKDLREYLSMTFRIISNPRKIIRQLAVKLVVFIVHPGDEKSFSVIRLGTFKKRVKVDINGRHILLRAKKKALLTASYQVDLKDVVDWENKIVLCRNCFLKTGNLLLNPRGKSNNKNLFKKEIHKDDFFDRFRISCEKDRQNGLYYACYDLDDRTFRLASWIWTNAVIAKAWWVKGKIRKNKILINRAIDLSNALMRFQITQGRNKGAFLCRIDITPVSELGYIEWYAPNDSALIGGYALAPLYRRTKNKKVLDALLSLGKWITCHGMHQDGRLRVGYHTPEKKWDDSWLYVDSGFTNVLFRELYEITGDKYWQNICEKFTVWYIDAFSDSTGAMRSHWFEKKHRPQKHFFSRGQGWAIEGLLASYECTKRKEFLDRAIKIAEFMLEEQQDSGGWFFETRDRKGGECNKATPVMAYSLARLYFYVKESRFLYGAMKALAWCEEKKYRGDDMNAREGIVSWTWEGCITRPRNRRTVVPYANAYASMAKEIISTNNIYDNGNKRK